MESSQYHLGIHNIIAYRTAGACALFGIILLVSAVLIGLGGVGIGTAHAQTFDRSARDIIRDIREPRAPEPPAAPTAFGYGGGFEFPPVEPPDNSAFRGAFDTFVERFTSFFSNFFGR